MPAPRREPDQPTSGRQVGGRQVRGRQVRGRQVGDMGRDYQAGLSRAHRHRTGSFYTPLGLATGLGRAAFTGLAGDTPLRVCDPSCGGGAFLLAAADLLESRTGLARSEIAADLLWGSDVDAAAVGVAHREVQAWVDAGDRSTTADVSGHLARHIVVGDPLTDGPSVWGPGPPAFDLVMGNPPFQSQLARTTTRSGDHNAVVCARLGVPVAPYTDTAALFLLVGLELVRPGGRVLLIQPQSVLSARDAGTVRTEVLARSTLVGFWADDAPHFDASVQVCAPIIDRTTSDPGGAGTGAAGAVRRWTGGGVDGAATFHGSHGSLSSTWSPLLAAAQQVPSIDWPPWSPSDPIAGRDPRSSREISRLGDGASVTAGFRQHFYGLIPFVGESGRPTPVSEPGAGVEAPEGSADRGPIAGWSETRLVTSGLIDPANERWGRATTRFGGRTFRWPVVDVDALAASDPEVAAWGAALARPKLLVATQTRVVEVISDRDGSRWPSVPVIAVTAPAGDLSRLAAVLMSPAVSAWALTNFAGAALAADAIKLSATQIRQIPLPTGDLRAWDAAAQEFEAAERCARHGDAEGWSTHLDELGRHMGTAYGVSDDVLVWWQARRPRFRG